MDEERAADAKRYRQECAALGMSLEAMARELGVSLSTSQRYASGKSQIKAQTWRAIEDLKGKKSKKARAKTRPR